MRGRLWPQFPPRNRRERKKKSPSIDVVTQQVVGEERKLYILIPVKKELKKRNKSVVQM